MRGARSHVPISAFLPASQSHSLSLLSIPTILLPPLIFGGLVITLWTYKCIMMVIFQNKIIYMPSVPPFSRSEKVEDYAIQCRPVMWREHDLRAADGVALKLLEGGVCSTSNTVKRVAVLYFQGNAASLPPRLPYLSAVLNTLQTSNDNGNKPPEYTIFALSYRGFWTSRGRATQPGIELDAQAALRWLSRHLSQQNPASDTTLILWGQSIGAGVTTTALATLLTQQVLNSKPFSPIPKQPPPLRIHTLLLETPFLSIRSMLVALYPQRLLPYRYLWPFLRSTWDSEKAIKEIATAAAATTAATATRDATPLATTARKPPAPLKKILILQAGTDEIVPASQSEALERICRDQLGGLGVEVQRVVVAGALHTEIMSKPAGRGEVVRVLKEAAIGGGGGAEEGGKSRTQGGRG